MANVERITVLLSLEQSSRLSQYCETQGFKKSTLIARLIKEHLDMTTATVQEVMPYKQSQPNDI